MSIGEKIKKLRQEKQLTQKEIADKLFVTAQAVSRWEKDEVEPDLKTIQELSKMLGVTVDYLISNDEEVTKEVKQEVAVTEPVVQQLPVLAVCEKCNRPIYKSEDIVRITHSHGRNHSTKEVRCKECDEKFKKAQKEAEITEAKKRRIKSYIWGAIALIVTLIIMLSVATDESICEMYSLSQQEATIYGVVISILMFPFISCIFLDNNFIGDLFTRVASWGFVTFPGLIFSLDLDGIIWFLTVKLAFFLIGLLLAILCTLLAFFLCLALSIFVYPFALVKSFKNPEYTY